MPELEMNPQDREDFQRKLESARKIAVLTGAGVAAESGVPTFRGGGGLWRRHEAARLSSLEAWEQDPGLVWAFYNYLRETILDAQPNRAHQALSRFESRCRTAGRTFALLTQNIDGLHEEAGSENVTRLHGSIWQVRCLACDRVSENRDVPITPAFVDSSAPDRGAPARRFMEGDLPRCDCGGAQRPDVVLSGEIIESSNMAAAADAIDHCDIMLVVGTSAVSHPAAGLVPLAKRYGAVIAEINIEPSAGNIVPDFFFAGRAGEVLPALLEVTLR